MRVEIIPTVLQYILSAYEIAISCDPSDAVLLTGGRSGRESVCSAEKNRFGPLDKIIQLVLMKVEK